MAVVSDLIHCFVRLTTQSDKNYKDREQLQQLNKFDEPALFAVQLLHRWFVIEKNFYLRFLLVVVVKDGENLCTSIISSKTSENLSSECVS